MFPAVVAFWVERRRGRDISLFLHTPAGEGMSGGNDSAGGVRFLGGGNLRCFSNARCLSGFRREFGHLENVFSRFPVS